LSLASLLPAAPEGGCARQHDLVFPLAAPAGKTPGILTRNGIPAGLLCLRFPAAPVAN